MSSADSVSVIENGIIMLPTTNYFSSDGLYVSFETFSVGDVVEGFLSLQIGLNKPWDSQGCASPFLLFVQNTMGISLSFLLFAHVLLGTSERHL